MRAPASHLDGKPELSASRTSTPRFFAFHTIAIILSATLTLMSLEALSRLFAPAWLVQRMRVLNPPSDGGGFGSDRAWKAEFKNGKFWRLAPLSEVDVTHYEYDIKAHIDEYGGRAVQNSATAPRADASLIPFLGDSFTFGVGVRDSETFASLLSPLASPARALNLGINGTALVHHLDIVEMRHEELHRPKKYVFFFWLGNDFDDLVLADRREHAEPQGNPLRPWENSTAWTVNGFVSQNAILKHSYFLQFVRRLALLALNAGAVEGFYDPLFFIADKNNGPYLRAAETALRAQLDRLVEMQKRLGFTSLLVVIPSVYQTNRELLAYKRAEYGLDQDRLDIQLPNRILSEQANAHGLELVDSTPCMTKRNTDQSLYYVQDIHLTAKGHKAFAECIAGEVREFLTQ